MGSPFSGQKLNINRAVRAAPDFLFYETIYRRIRTVRTADVGPSGHACHVIGDQLLLHFFHQIKTRRTMNHLSIEVYEHTPINHHLLAIVGYNNGGEGSVTLEAIKGFLECERVTMPCTMKDLVFYIEQISDDKRVMPISFRDRRLSLSITETLIKSTTNDLLFEDERPGEQIIENRMPAGNYITAFSKF